VKTLKKSGFPLKQFPSERASVYFRLKVARSSIATPRCQQADVLYHIYRISVNT
jgi:hypothetical protein